VAHPSHRQRFGREPTRAIGDELEVGIGDAIQKQGSEGLHVCQHAQDGQEVGEGNPEHEEPPKEGCQERQEEVKRKGKKKGKCGCG